MSDEKKIIKVTKNGPYILQNIKKLENSKGETISIKGVGVLCRCGKSTNKPFCNGTHTKVNFTDEKETDKKTDRVDIYEGKHITIYDNRGVCSQRGYCSEELPNVWNDNQDPWIDPDGATVEEIIRICEKCPSGALSYSLPGEERNLKGNTREEKICISPMKFNVSGPYDIKGGIKLDDPYGNKPESSDHFNLCRCGASKNKPFCSGEHLHIKFIDEND